MKLTRVLGIASITLTALSGPLMAATDGTIGSTSSGTSVLTMTKQDAVQISDVDDISLGIKGNLVASETGSDDLCIFTSTGAYTVTVTSNNDAFQLEDANTTTVIPYSVNCIVASSRAVTYGIPVNGLIGNSTAVDCEAGTNATFQVTVAAVDFNAATPGDYRDTLTLLVSPE